jgi:diguanylate cyclase (GGDEF)-like protein
LIDRAGTLHSHARKRRYFGLAALAAIGLLVALIIGNAFAASSQRREAETSYVHSFDVLLAASELKTSIHGALRGERGYLLTGDRAFLAPYNEGRAGSLALLGRLRLLANDDRAQLRQLGAIGRELDVYLATLARLIALEEAGRHDEALSLVRAGVGRRHVADLLTAVDRFEAEERRLLARRRAASASADRRAQRQNVIIAIIGAVLMALVTAAVLSATRAHKRALGLAGDLQRLATTDALTGLPNRRQLMFAMETEVRRAGRSGRPLALALLDVDHFKAVNDTHGHPAGDEVLRCVADELLKVTRGGDVLGRFGGEEFAVLMPETSLAQARQAGERLRRAIASRTIAYPDGTIGRVTVSVGVALLAGEEGSDHLISRTDAALYEAKANGRNLVRLAA